MIPKRYQEAKTGFQVLNLMNAKKFLNKMGLGKEDYYFWKRVGKALVCTYTIMGALWVYNETPKPRPKEERVVETEEAMIGTTIGPKGMVDETDKELQSKKFNQEAQKLWLRMRNEVIAELQEKGFDVE